MESTFLLADSGLIAAWAISIALTLLLIVPPLAYLAVLTFATNESGFDRAVNDIEAHVKRRALADARGKDVFGILEEPSGVTPTPTRQRDRGASRAVSAPA
jgi:hypothetical protein